MPSTASISNLRPGEIHAVLGENGAGKSTLCKAISGAIELTSGDYILGGAQVSFSSPGEALKNGVAMVYQETSLVPSMTVAQNLELGMEKFFTIYRKINIAAQQSQQALNFNVDPLALVETLGTAKRQMVEIARAVRHNARVIIFDEPTASLTPEEMQHLFHLLHGPARAGRWNSSIFISHALEEALKIADRITVLRDGKLVHTGPAAGLDRPAIVRMMVGRDIAATHYAAVEAEGVAAIEPPANTVKDKRRVLSVENVTMGSVVKNMSFSVYEGEVVGIAGLVGSGRTEIAHIICGARKRNFLRGGLIYLNDRPIRYRVPRQAVRDGIVYITEDRKLDGFFETMTVDDNIYLGYLASPKGVAAAALFAQAEEEDRRSLGQGTLHLCAQAQSENRGIFRRQPAESRCREIAGAGALGRDLRRADARCRCRRDPANSCRHSRAGGRRQGRHRDLVVPAGSHGDLRSHPGGEGRPDRRGNDRRPGHRRKNHVCRDSLRVKNSDRGVRIWKESHALSRVGKSRRA